MAVVILYRVVCDFLDLRLSGVCVYRGYWRQLRRRRRRNATYKDTEVSAGIFWHEQQWH